MLYSSHIVQWRYLLTGLCWMALNLCYRYMNLNDKERWALFLDYIHSGNIPIFPSIKLCPDPEANRISPHPFPQVQLKIKEKDKLMHRHFEHNQKWLWEISELSLHSSILSEKTYLYIFKSKWNSVFEFPCDFLFS